MLQVTVSDSVVSPTQETPSAGCEHVLARDRSPPSQGTVQTDHSSQADHSMPTTTFTLSHNCLHSVSSPGKQDNPPDQAFQDWDHFRKMA